MSLSVTEAGGDNVAGYLRVLTKICMVAVLCEDYQRLCIDDDVARDDESVVAEKSGRCRNGRGGRSLKLEGVL